MREKVHPCSKGSQDGPHRLGVLGLLESHPGNTRLATAVDGENPSVLNRCLQGRRHPQVEGAASQGKGSGQLGQLQRPLERVEGIGDVRKKDARTQGQAPPLQIEAQEWQVNGRARPRPVAKGGLYTKEAMRQKTGNGQLGQEPDGSKDGVSFGSSRECGVRQKGNQDSKEVIRALDEIIRRASEARASDIHLEPKSDRLRIRFRIDGVMVDQGTMAWDQASPIVSRVKVLSRMDIAERRLPQDGTFESDVSSNQTVSLRASTFPCVDGEKAVLRILRGGDLIPLNSLGFGQGQRDTVQALAAHNGGLLLVTGPTGAGKTSTLYAILNELDTERLNVVTLEDPIEVPLDAVTQGQVNRRAGFDFTSGLRSILRQDPDVILVGEMRDRETAAIAVQASLTGHLVLSTMHTNSTIDTITRLIDLGVEPYIVAQALLGVIAQRLVRLICERCRESYTTKEDMSREWGYPVPVGTTLYRPKGCPNCLETGYKGRRGIYEVVAVNDKLRHLVKAKADPPAYKAIFREMGLPSLRQIGMRQAVKGRTSVDEILRIT